MAASERVNLPRFHGQRGFFEIWFLVIFEPGRRRACWLRYTTFSPASGQAGGARATLWAAVFDAAAAEPVVAAKAIFPLEAFQSPSPDRFLVRIGDSELGHGFCRGEVRSPEHVLAWDLRFTTAAEESFRTPRRLHGLPLGTHGHHANTEVGFQGSLSIDGETRQLVSAVGTQVHLHGTKRVEELRWLYAPSLENAGGGTLPEGEHEGAIEVCAVRPVRSLGPLDLPGATSVWLRTGRETLDLCDVPGALFHRAEAPGIGLLRVTAKTASRVVTARAWCDPRTLAGYVYRDPGGQDLFVAQSDIASCQVDVLTRAHLLGALRPERRLVCQEGAALELHGPEPLPGVRYIPWDEVDRPRVPEK